MHNLVDIYFFLIEGCQLFHPLLSTVDLFPPMNHWKKKCLLKYSIKINGQWQIFEFDDWKDRRHKADLVDRITHSLDSETHVLDIHGYFHP